MKRIALLLLAFLLVTCSCCSCALLNLRDTLVIPSEDVIGKSYTFKRNCVTITLTDKFAEKVDPTDPDVHYYESDFCGVMIWRELFSENEAFADMSREEYLTYCAENNGIADITVKQRDDLVYFVFKGDEYRGWVYAYQGYDSFYVVQFYCSLEDSNDLKDIIYLWASGVSVE